MEEKRLIDSQSSRSSRLPAHHEVVATCVGRAGLGDHRGCGRGAPGDVLRSDSASELILALLGVARRAERVVDGDVGDVGGMGQSGERVGDGGESDHAGRGGLDGRHC